MAAPLLLQFCFRSAVASGGDIVAAGRCYAAATGRRVGRALLVGVVGTAPLAGAGPAGATPAGAGPAGAGQVGAAPVGVTSAGTTLAGATLAGAMPVGVAPAGTTPAGATPVDAGPAGITPAGATPVGAAPAGATPVGAAPAGAAPVGAAPAGVTPAGAAPGRADLGPALMARYHCGSCHRIPGVPAARGDYAVTLEGFGRRSYIAGRVPNTPEMLVRWIRDPESVVPGTPMPNLGVSAADAHAMAAFLGTLR